MDVKMVSKAVRLKEETKLESSTYQAGDYRCPLLKQKDHSGQVMIRPI